MANVDILLGDKSLAWFTANPTLVLKKGQIVFLEGQSGTYKKGDNVTQLSALSFLGGNGLAYTPEDASNKSLDVNTDQASNTKYPSVKAVYDWATGLFVKKGTITNNTILKGSGTDTATDSQIFDNGTNVGIGTTSPAAVLDVNGRIFSRFGGIYSNDVYNYSGSLLNLYGSLGIKLFVNGGETLTISGLGVVNIPQLTASQRVETDSNKNFVSVAKGTADNKNFGTTAGTVLEGNRITQVITDGVTDKAPSEDAVFDALALRIPQNSWVDISGTATIVGWSSYTYNKIQYKDLGDSYCIDVYISGTSNSGLTTIQLPFTLTSNHGSIVFVTNNGVSSAGRVTCISTDTLDFRSSPAAAGWTASGLKQVSCNFTIKK